jgi:lipoprotein-releasing system permease protein
MYKFLLCWRYLRTRYIALASIISVTLGVATMIVVNSVMSGFTTEMRNRLHGILSDVVLESRSLNGFYDAQYHMEIIRRVAGDAIEGMTPTVAVPAMLSFDYRGETVTRPVQLIGVDGTTQGRVSDFGKYLQHPANRKSMDFQLRDGGYDTRDHQAGPDAPERPQLAKAGWPWRRMVAEEEAFTQRLDPPVPKAAPQPEASAAPDVFGAAAPAEKVFDPAKEQHTGVVLGIALTCYRDHEGEDHFVVLPGDDVQIAFPDTASPPKVGYDSFTIVDFYESKMSEYDQQFVFVPIAQLQRLRGMIDPTSQIGRVNQIQIKLKPGADGIAVRDRLREAFPAALYTVSTWQDKQGPLLAAVQMETAILNVLLFLIIAVAGFGILAIFLMIVIDKTRDIGILKSLGASRGGIMGIFLGYGLSLGLVGSGVGLVLGLLMVKNINALADLLGSITGHKVFDPAIYYFYKIPTLVDPWTIAWIVSGTLGIAVLASVLPALRAAMLHPVEALRYE